MKNPMTPTAGIEPATFRFVAQHLNHLNFKKIHTTFFFCYAIWIIHLNRINIIYVADTW